MHYTLNCISGLIDADSYKTVIHLAASAYVLSYSVQYPTTVIFLTESFSDCYAAARELSWFKPDSKLSPTLLQTHAR